MADREVRYCTTEDGVRIAYWVRGTGKPIVMQSLFLNQMSAETDGESVARNFTSRQRMVIRFDGRGVGLSQRNLDDFSLEARVLDLDAVVGASQIESFDLIGDMWSGPIAVDYAVRHPGRVVHLVLARTYPRAADITSRERWQALVELARTNWRMAAEVFAGIDNPNRTGNPRTFQILGEGVNGEDAAKWLAQQYEIDVTELLPQITVPTLVLNSRDDRSVRFELGRDMAARIPDARFIELGGRGLELNDTIMQAVAAFINEANSISSEAPSGTALRTVLFTDLVGHTEMMSRLGDERGRDVLREHERITRECLAAHGGAEVKTMGDGFMASFGSVTRAVECAVALQKAFEARNAPVGAPLGDGGGAGGAAPNDAAMQNQPSVEPLHVRVGLNAGEPIEEDGDLFGATVILASRIAAKADGGEILVADTVRGLCSGKGFLFADRGEFVAKGFEEPVRVYEVRWRE
jgi:class 3 adenylate cyclase/pimeloyl-ACP methyl ester carboxylesterase